MIVRVVITLIMKTIGFVLVAFVAMLAAPAPAILFLLLRLVLCLLMDFDRCFVPLSCPRDFSQCLYCSSSCC